MSRVEWYFDYVSPFSYLQWAHQLPQLHNIEIEFKPVLFAGLLKHWGHKGPAEIQGKRRFTYRYVLWLAARLGVAFRMPSAHPFNPLPLLRLSLARNNRSEIVERLFTFVWRDGHIPSDETAWRALIDELAVTEQELKDPAIKQGLFDNGEQALSKGVFGVPSVVVDNEVFWGVDGFDFLWDYLDDPGVVDTSAMRAAHALPSDV